MAKKTKVACIGNSITFGYLLPDPAGDSYPAQLAEMLGDDYEVGNFGKSGATLLRHGHRPYFEQEEFRNALKFKPDIAVVHLGINDTDPRNFPNFSDEFVGDYIALIDSLKAANPDVRIIIANLSPLLSKHPRFRSGTLVWRDKLRALIPVVAKAAGAELIDFGDVLRDSPNLLPDGIHPNKTGARMMADAVRKAITGQYGGLRLADVYSDGMVLQRNKPLVIRGHDDAGATVVVEVNGRRASAVADNRGRWKAVLPPMKEAMGLVMTITDGRKTLTYNDVAIGEVWIASGQSNMAFMNKESATFAEDAEEFADSLLRLFNMKPVAYTGPNEWTPAQLALTDSLRHFKTSRWQRSSAESAPDFSAVAWRFGKALRDSLNVPVGIICNAIDGSPTEAWVDIETLEHGMPEILVNHTTNDYLQPWVQQRINENIGTGTRHRHPYEPSYLYAAGIRPLEAYPVAGVVWYQGESNAHNIELHEQLFRLLTESWRSTWSNPDLPFIFVQLSSINRPSWPAFRDSQRRLAQSVAGTYMAVSSDWGDSIDVHPKNKRPIGERAGRQALRNIYSMMNVVPQGPTVSRAEKTGQATVRITFDYADGLATSDGRSPATFELAEMDGIYHPADKAEIIDNTITLTCMATDNPHFIRYGWQPFTRANVVNSDGLPASTFKIEINEAPDTEEGIDSGVSAAYVGTAGDLAIRAGGCNFPSNPMAPDSRKKFYQGIYAIGYDGQTAVAKKIGELPYPMAYGAAISTPEGLVIAGGTTDSSALDYAAMLTIDSDSVPSLTPLPALPATVDNMAGAYLDGKIYIAGGNVDGQPSNALYCLDLSHKSDGWKTLKPFPGNPRVQPILAASEGRLYLWGGFAGKGPGREASLNTDGFEYDPAKNKWKHIDAPTDEQGQEVATGGGVAATLPDGRIIAAGGVNKDIFLEALRNQAPDYLSHPAEWYRFNQLVMTFDPQTGTWTIIDKCAGTARAGAGIAIVDGGALIIGGEIKPRIRTADIIFIPTEVAD